MLWYQLNKGQRDIFIIELIDIEPPINFNEKVTKLMYLIIIFEVEM